MSRPIMDIIIPESISWRRCGFSLIRDAQPMRVILAAYIYARACRVPGVIVQAVLMEEHPTTRRTAFRPTWTPQCLRGQQIPVVYGWSLSAQGWVVSLAPWPCITRASRC